jgi:hypothetical protein
MIPDEEIERLVNAIHYAIQYCHEGRLVDGYNLLLEGRRHAERLRDAGEPWGEELVDRWRGACDNYAESYGLPLG